MEGYEQFCPVAKASEIVTRRWTPLVIRELLCGSRRFNEIHRGVPRMSRSLLVRRPAELERADVVGKRGGDEGSVRSRCARGSVHRKACDRTALCSRIQTLMMTYA